MSLVSGALRRPITVMVITAGLAVFSIIAIFNIPIDIFPKLNSPTIYVIESYGGMSAQQIEGFVKYPPRQKPASFNLDAVLAQIQDAGGGAQH